MISLRSRLGARVKISLEHPHMLSDSFVVAVRISPAHLMGSLRRKPRKSSQRVYEFQDVTAVHVKNMFETASKHYELPLVSPSQSLLDHATTYKYPYSLYGACISTIKSILHGEELKR